MRETDGEVVYGHLRRAGNANYGLNKGLLAPPAPAAGEKHKFVDLGGGIVGCVFRDHKTGIVNRRAGRSDLRSAGVSNTFCER